MPLTISKPDPVPYLRTLIMGQPKVGKTTWVGTSEFKTLIVDFEGGDAVLPTNDNIFVAHASSILDLNDIPKILEEEKFEMLVIDSISSANTKAFLELLTSESQKKKEKERGRDENRAEIQDYAYLQNMFIRMVYELIQLPVHVVLTAHPMSKVHIEMGTRYVPNVKPNKLPEILLSMMNEVIYLAQDKQNKRFLLVSNFPEYSVNCRVRHGIVLPDSIESPTMSKYFEALRGEYVEAGEKPEFSTVEERKMYDDNDIKPTEKDE